MPNLVVYANAGGVPRGQGTLVGAGMVGTSYTAMSADEWMQCYVNDVKWEQNIERGWLGFDTSGLPDDATITLVALYIRTRLSYSYSGIRAVRCFSDPTGAASDFQKMYSSGFQQYSTLDLLMSNSAGWNGRTLGNGIFDAVNKTGNTFIGLVHATEIDGNTYHDVHTYFNGPPSTYKPYLYIEYTEAAVGTEYDITLTQTTNAPVSLIRKPKKVVTLVSEAVSTLVDAVKIAGPKLYEITLTTLSNVSVSISRKTQSILSVMSDVTVSISRNVQLTRSLVSDVVTSQTRITKKYILATSQIIINVARYSKISLMVSSIVDISIQALKTTGARLYRITLIAVAEVFFRGRGE